MYAYHVSTDDCSLGLAWLGVAWRGLALLVCFLASNESACLTLSSATAPLARSLSCLSSRPLGVPTHLALTSAPVPVPSCPPLLRVCLVLDAQFFYPPGGAENGIFF